MFFYEYQSVSTCYFLLPFFDSMLPLLSVLLAQWEELAIARRGY